ncbi:hypothetical protein PanWU01x14_036020 [Parasponia andersonii]|uniref:Transmembrane protein n=1 Tax=Parasponia andersonii TaxID=3476 RepID=A0A2P5DSB6_PARAD|nr:hypothetical protein PanWU01x14_036020 [Parasponia andersonii]
MQLFHRIGLTFFYFYYFKNGNSIFSANVWLVLLILYPLYIFLFSLFKYCQETDFSDLLFFVEVLNCTHITVLGLEITVCSTCERLLFFVLLHYAKRIQLQPNLCTSCFCWCNSQ